MANVTVASAAKCTVVLQTALETENRPVRSLGTVGFIKALLAPANRQGFTGSEKFWGRGKPTVGASCTYQISYVKPICDAPAANADICTSPGAGTTMFGRWDFVYEAADVTPYKGNIPESIAMCAIESINDQLQASISGYAEAILKNVEQKLIEKAIDQMGKYSTNVVSTTTPIDLKIFTTNGTAVQPVGWLPAITQFAKASAHGRLIAVGGYSLKTYIDAINLAGVVNNNVKDALPFDFYFSSSYDAACTAKAVSEQSVIIFAPGEFQYVPYFDHVKSAENPLGEQFSANYTRTKLTVPTENGDVMFDWELHYRPECKGFDWGMSQTAGLFFQPASDCAAYPNRRLFFTLGCGDATCQL